MRLLFYAIFIDFDAHIICWFLFNLFQCEKLFLMINLINNKKFSRIGFNLCLFACFANN